MKLESIFHALDLSYKMRVEGLETATLHLIGPPGIGKSAAVRDFAKTLAAELNKKFVDFDDLSPDEVESILKSPDQYFIFADKRLTGLDPVDVSGIPRPVKGSKYIMFLPLALAQLLNKCAGILFLDEFLNESRSNMLAQAYKIVRDYKIGDISLSKSALVVAASNSSEHSSIVGSIPKPLRDRFVFIEVDPPSIEAWVDWMDRTYGRWDRTVLGYLRWKPSDFLNNTNDTVEDNGFEPPATPRGWTYIALAFARIKDEEMRASLAKGKLGRVGEAFVEFLRNKVPSFEELIKSPHVLSEFSIEKRILSMISVAEAINASPHNIRKTLPIVEYISKSEDRELMALLFFLMKKDRKYEAFEVFKSSPLALKCMELASKAIM